jgi:hypothetical protein
MSYENTINGDVMIYCNRSHLRFNAPMPNVHDPVNLLKSIFCGCIKQTHANVVKIGII